MSTRVNSRLVVETDFDGAEAGEGLAIFFSQGPVDVGRYRFLVRAITSQGTYDMGEFYTSPPGATAIPGRLTRMVAGAVCPGATSWNVHVSCVPSPETPADETAEVTLTSSKCCTAPIGVTRVAERYAYHAGSGTSTFTVRAGMRVTGIAVVGLTGGGTITIAGGDAITVPVGVGMNLEPGGVIAPNSAIVLTNVDWVIEYLESA